MPPVGPIKRRELVAALRTLGYYGPFAGKRHQFMRRAERTVRLPNPHRGEISRGLLVRILRRHLTRAVDELPVSLRHVESDQRTELAPGSTW